MSGEGFDRRWMHASIPRSQWHFFQRVYAHYRIVFAPGDFSAMLKDIQRGRAQWLRDQGNGSAIYSVRVQSVFERIFIVVSKERHVITALPPTRDLKKLRLLRELEQGRARIRVVRRNEDGD